MKKIILLCLVIVLSLSGCRTISNVSEPEINEQNVEPDMMAVTNINESRFSYIIDKRTHVVYMQFYCGCKAGITAVLKADGTPMLAEDLGIKVD